MVDTLPAIPGLAKRWGKSAFACPYCDGNELDLGNLGVLASNPMAAHQAQLVAGWGATTLFTHGVLEPDAEQLAGLAQQRVTTERTPIVRIESPMTVHLADGRSIPLTGLFLAPRSALPGPFAEQLGLALDESPVGTYYKTDMMLSVSFAVADGVRAGIATHQSLIFRSP